MSVWIMVLLYILLLLLLLSSTIRRFTMQAVLALLFRVAFDPMVRVSTALLTPMFVNLSIDKVQIKDIISKTSLVLQGKTVTFEAMGIYTAAQQQEIVEGTADIVKAVLADFGLTPSTADIARLLDAVALKVLV